MNSAAIGKMSNTVIECELRAAWSDAEVNVRHGAEVPARISNYIAALTAEQVRRAAR